MTPSVVSFICRICDAHGHIGGISRLANCPDCGAAQIRCHAEILSLSLIHLDCDAFYASIEKRDQPDLRDKPVIVGGSNRRGVVAAACYIARQYGIRSAMPSWQAAKLCPDAIVLRPRMAHYTSESRKIRTLMLEATPLVEPLSIDEAFLDLSGTELLHKAPPAIVASRLQKRIFDEVGITVSIGLGGNKSLAKMASTRDKPDGFFIVGGTEARSWLAPQPISVLYGMGKSMVAKLNQLGITTCGDFAKVDLSALQAKTGRDCTHLHALAQGIDDRAVKTDSIVKSISAETTFHKDLANLDDLLAELEPLILRVSERLKAQTLSGKCVTLKLKSADHKVVTRSRTVPTAIWQAHRIEEIAHALLVSALKKGQTYRLIGIGVDGFTTSDDTQQLDLEPDISAKKTKLEAATDKVRKQLGTNAIQSGRRLLYEKSKHK